MKLVALVDELVHYVDMKEIKTERAASRRAHLMAAHSSTKLPAVETFLNKDTVTPYAGMILTAQAALAGKYSVALVTATADTAELTYVVAPMGPAANQIAAAYSAAHSAAVADGCDAAAAAIAAASTKLSAGGQAAAAAEVEQVGGLEWHEAADFCMQVEDRTAWRLTSLCSCSCQFYKHKG
jgi:hypothetical protein